MRFRRVEPEMAGRSTSNLVMRAIKDLALGVLRQIFFLFAKPLSKEDFRGSFLIIAPHPDDETLGCGAAIMRARKAGCHVRVLIVTDGRASSQSAVISPDELVAMRHVETERACRVLGVSSENIIFLNFTDGKIEDKVDAVAAELEIVVRQMKPDKIFSPYGIDGHADHRAVAAAVDVLAKRGVLTGPVYEYPIWFWPWTALNHAFRPSRLWWLRCVSSDGFLDRKREAIDAYRSQRVNLTGEKNWWTLEDRFLSHFLQPYELYFEKPSSRIKHSA